MRKLQKLQKGQDIDNWVLKWETTYEECRVHGLPEVQGRRAVEAFLMALHDIAPTFSDALLFAGKPYEFMDVLGQARDYLRARFGNKARAH